MSAPVFEAERITRRFRGVPAVDAVSLRVRAGESVCLLGPNGAGKTTLLRLAASLARPSSGVLRYQGAPAREAFPAARGWIGFASHHSLLYPELTVRENLEFHRRLHRAETDLGDLLARHGLLAVADTPARWLSRGTAQRATLARALLHAPALLLLDEPFSGLDAAAGERLSERIREARERGAALIAATHDVGRGLAIADRFIVLRRGRVIHEGPASDRGAALRLYREASLGRAPKAGS